MPTTTMQKLGGVLLGALALLGALLLVNWGYSRMTNARATTTGGMSAQEGQETIAAPCTTPPMTGAMPLVGCDCPQNVNLARNDLFPGSYVSFAYTNAGCDATPRNQRC